MGCAGDIASESKTKNSRPALKMPGQERISLAVPPCLTETVHLTHTKYADFDNEGSASVLPTYSRLCSARPQKPIRVCVRASFSPPETLCIGVTAVTLLFHKFRKIISLARVKVNSFLKKVILKFNFDFFHKYIRERSLYFGKKCFKKLLTKHTHTCIIVYIQNDLI